MQDNPADVVESDAPSFKQRVYGGLFSAAIAAFFRLIPVLGRLGPLGPLIAVVLMIGAVALFVLALIALMILQRQFEVTPAGQFVSLVLTIGGGLLAVYFWAGRQARTTWGALRLIVLAFGLAALAWWVWNSGFFHEARLNYMRARFEENPVFYVGRMYFLIASVVTGVMGAIWATQRFVRNAYRSPLHFILAVVRLSISTLIILVIAWLALSSGQLSNVRSKLDEALNPPWLMEQYSSPRQ